MFFNLTHAKTGIRASAGLFPFSDRDRSGIVRQPGTAGGSARRPLGAGDFTGTTGNGLDDVGHGTAVAGIIAGTQGGMAPQARVWAMKVLFNNDGSGSGSDAMILAGLQSVLANQNNFGGVHIVNMSLGGGDLTTLFADGFESGNTNAWN